MKYRKNCYWVVVDQLDNYMPSLHMTLRDAVQERERVKWYRDGKFVIKKMKLVKTV
jgi:hypothetical protein